MAWKLLAQLSLPEYRDRHVFTARLRLAIFVGFWFLYLYFYLDVLGQFQTVTILATASFLLTTLSYFWILKDRLVFLSVITEVLSDLVTITAVVYITEGPYSDYFTIYLFYIFVAGIFYNYQVALLVAVACGIFYGGFLLLCQAGVIPPLIIDWGETIPIESHSPQYHFFFWAVFAVLVVYGVKVASYFSQKRERMLEARNKELTALARMSSTIRSTISVEAVLEQILQGLQAGLDLDLAVLALFDREKNRITCLAPKEHPLVRKVLKYFEGDLSRHSFPMRVAENPALQAIYEHQIVFRKDLHEVLIGVEPPIPKMMAEDIQRLIGFKKLAAVPLVAEQELLGALIGFTHESYVDPHAVRSLEAFANQAALILETVLLIQRLKQANENLKEANRVKSEFLAIMSHELRTPLTAIIGFSELLLEGVMGPLSEEQSDSLKEVLNNGATLLDMINNLLDMAKVEAGKMTIEPHAFDLKDLVQRLTHAIGSLIQRKNQVVELHLPSQCPPIQADEKKIQQIILNLLSNAIKFTPEKGRIEISLEYHPEPVSPRIPKEEIFKMGAFELTVADSGIGIKSEEIPKVFEMFSQADSSVTRTYGGTGLGLALAKQLTELHGGVIWAESEYGKGTKFTVILPPVVL